MTYFIFNIANTILAVLLVGEVRSEDLAQITRRERDIVMIIRRKDADVK